MEVIVTQCSALGGVFVEFLVFRNGLILIFCFLFFAGLPGVRLPRCWRAQRE